jgi:hypothetical protein
MREFVTVTLLALALAPSARAQGPVLPLPPEDQQEITRLLGPGIVGQALPSQPIGKASSYFPLEERASVFQVTSGSNKGKQQTLRTMKGKRPGGSEAWRFELGPSLATFLSLDAGGSLSMPSVTDTDEGVIIISTPANPFVLQGMKPGESRSYSQKVSVNYLDDPSRVDYSGALDGTYTYVGTYQVTVPAGTFPAILVRLECSGKVGPAHTQDTAYYFLSPKIGVVAMISQEDVEAFWIIHIDTKSGKVLASR